MSTLEIINQFHQRLWGDKNSQAIADFFHPDATIHSPVETTQGTEKMRDIIEAWYTAFPDLVVEWQDTICEANKVVCRWTARGHHKGVFLSHAATEREVEYPGITIYAFEDNKIAEYWALVDMRGLLEQIQSA